MTTDPRILTRLPDTAYPYSRIDGDGDGFHVYADGRTSMSVGTRSLGIIRPTYEEAIDDIRAQLPKRTDGLIDVIVTGVQPATIIDRLMVRDAEGIVWYQANSVDIRRMLSRRIGVVLALADAAALPEPDAAIAAAERAAVYLGVDVSPAAIARIVQVVRDADAATGGAS